MAQALVRVYSGESPEDTVPKPGELAFDLALDALSPFVPGGPAITRFLSLAVRSGKRTSHAVKASKILIDDDRGVLKARSPIRMGRPECAIVMENLNTYYHTRLKG